MLRVRSTVKLSMKKWWAWILISLDYSTAEAELTNASQALSALEASTNLMRETRKAEEERLAMTAAGNASLASAKGKLAAGEFVGANAAIRSAAQFFKAAGESVWSQMKDAVLAVEQDMASEERAQQVQAEHNAYSRSGDAALADAHAKLAADDLAGANAASAAAANFYCKAGAHGESKSSELAELDRRILEAAASFKSQQQMQARLRQDMEDERREAVRRAEEEAETWKKKAEEEKAKALAAQIKLVSNGSSFAPQVAGAEEAEEVRQARRALELLELAKREAQAALEAMQRAYEVEEDARKQQELADALAKQAEQELLQRRKEEEEAVAMRLAEEREARERKRLVEEELERVLVEEERAKARARQRQLKFTNESMNWPASRQEAMEHNITSEAHWILLTTQATPILQAAFRRQNTASVEKRRESACTLLRFLQAQWEQVDGHSRIIEGRRDEERARRIREEAQRARLAEAAEAKRLAERSLNQRLLEEATARQALEQALDRRSKEVARLKAHDEGERARKMAEEAERRGIQDAMGRERENDRERDRLERDREWAVIQAQREEEEEETLLREKKGLEDRQERRRKRNQGERLWGGWRRELGVKKRNSEIAVCACVRVQGACGRFCISPHLPPVCITDRWVVSLFHFIFVLYFSLYFAANTRARRSWCQPSRRSREPAPHPTGLPHERPLSPPSSETRTVVVRDREVGRKGG